MSYYNEDVEANHVLVRYPWQEPGKGWLVDATTARMDGKMLYVKAIALDGRPHSGINDRGEVAFGHRNVTISAPGDPR